MFHAIYQEICSRFERYPNKTILIWKNYLAVIIRMRNKKHITPEESGEIDDFLYGMITYYEALFENDQKFMKCKESVNIFTNLMHDYINYEAFILKEFDLVCKRIEKIIKMSSEENNWIFCANFMKVFLNYEEDDSEDYVDLQKFKSVIEYIRNFYKRGINYAKGNVTNLTQNFINFEEIFGDKDSIIIAENLVNDKISKEETRFFITNLDLESLSNTHSLLVKKPPVAYNTEKTHHEAEPERIVYNIDFKKNDDGENSVESPLGPIKKMKLDLNSTMKNDAINNGKGERVTIRVSQFPIETTLKDIYELMQPQLMSEISAIRIAKHSQKAVKDVYFDTYSVLTQQKLLSFNNCKVNKYELIAETMSSYKKEDSKKADFEQNSEHFSKKNYDQETNPGLISKISYPKKVTGRIKEECLTLFNLPDDTNEEFIWDLFGTKRMPGLKRLKIKGKVAYMDFYHVNSLLDQMGQLPEKVKIEDHKLIFLSEHDNTSNNPQEKYASKIREIIAPKNTDSESKMNEEKIEAPKNEEILLTDEIPKTEEITEETPKIEEIPKIEVKAENQEKEVVKKSNKDFRALFLK